MPSSRPVLRNGDTGSQVALLQERLLLTADGDFGPQTDAAVREYQSRKGLSTDGVVGGQTWTALNTDATLPPYPPPLPPVFTADELAQIKSMAAHAPISQYSWRDRGRAPSGYIKGIAVTWAYVYRRWKAKDPIALEMAKAAGNENVDALAWYEGIFENAEMEVGIDGSDTLRSLFVLLMGLGMRESSGKYCEGRDMSASNVSADTAE